MYRLKDGKGIDCKNHELWIIYLEDGKFKPLLLPIHLLSRLKSRTELRAISTSEIEQNRSLTTEYSICIILKDITQ